MIKDSFKDFCDLYFLFKDYICFNKSSLDSKLRFFNVGNSKYIVWHDYLDCLWIVEAENGEEAVKEISEKIVAFGKFANRHGEDSTGIEVFDFSVRTYNLLRRAGIHTVGDLTKLSFDQIKKIRHLGPKSAEEIFSKLNERGIMLNE